GRWKDRQLLSAQWVDWALTPTPAEPAYGFMNWYNNRDRKLFPSAPASAFAHIGNGTNIVYVDPDHDLVAVARWIERRSIDELVKRLLAALRNQRLATRQAIAPTRAAAPATRGSLTGS